MEPENDSPGGQTDESGQEKPPEAYDPEAMEDSLRHALSAVRLMGIRDHHVMRSPGELISFAKLLLRWRHNSFYVISYCAGLKSGGFSLQVKQRSRVRELTAIGGGYCWA